MAKGYIDLPLSTRLLGQQVEYSQDSDTVSVADFSATATTAKFLEFYIVYKSLSLSF